MRLNKRQIDIIVKLLNNNDYTTAKELANVLSLSVRTIKSDIKNINSLINSNDFYIYSKSGFGYKLIISHNFDFNKLNDLKLNSKIPNNYYERLLYVVKRILICDNYLKLDEIASDLFISRKNLSKVMKEIRIRLAQFDLKIKSKPYYGLYLEGSEQNKRNAMVEYFFNENYNLDIDFEIKYFHNYEMYRQIIIDVCREYYIEISDFSCCNLASYLIVNIYRCNLGFCINDYDLNEINRSVNDVEFIAANKILTLIGIDMKLEFSYSEIYYLSQHLKYKQIVKNNNLRSEQLTKLEKCLNLMLLEINNNFGLSLSVNDDWYKFLKLHIPQMVDRLKYKMTIRNNLTKDLARKYLFATKITHSAVLIIEQVYNIKVNSDEFSYLLLYFNLAITNFERSKQLKIGLDFKKGRPESLMLTNEIKEYFSSSKYVFIDVNDYNCRNIDLIVTNDISYYCSNIPVLQINFGNYLEKLISTINEIRYKSFNLSMFLSSEYCIFDLPGENKEEVLLNFYKELLDKGLIYNFGDNNNHFIDKELGNGVIHFQDSYRIVKKNMICICVLKNPVLWDWEIVQILILIKTKRDNDQDLYNICRLVSKWMENKNLLSSLIKNKNFDILNIEMSSIYRDL